MSTEVLNKTNGRMDEQSNAHNAIEMVKVRVCNRETRRERGEAGQKGMME